MRPTLLSHDRGEAEHSSNCPTRRAKKQAKMGNGGLLGVGCAVRDSKGCRRCTLLLAVAGPENKRLG